MPDTQELEDIVVTGIRQGNFAVEATLLPDTFYFSHLGQAYQIDPGQ